MSEVKRYSDSREVGDYNVAVTPNTDQDDAFNLTINDGKSIAFFEGVLKGVTSHEAEEYLTAVCGLLDLEMSAEEVCVMVGKPGAILQAYRTQTQRLQEQRQEIVAVTRENLLATRQPVEKPQLKSTRYEVVINGITIILASYQLGNYLLSLPGTNMAKLAEKMSTRNGGVIDVSRNPNGLLERAKELAAEGKSKEDIVVTLSMESGMVF